MGRAYLPQKATLAQLGQSRPSACRSSRAPRGWRQSGDRGPAHVRGGDKAERRVRVRVQVGRGRASSCCPILISRNLSRAAVRPPVLQAPCHWVSQSRPRPETSATSRLLPRAASGRVARPLLGLCIWARPRSVWCPLSIDQQNLAYRPLRAAAGAELIHSKIDIGLTIFSIPICL